MALVSRWPLTFIHRTCPYYPFMQRSGRFHCHQLCNDFPAIFPTAPCALGMGKGLSQDHRHFHPLILVSVLVWSQGPQPGQQLPPHLLCPSSSPALQSQLAPGSSPHTSVSASLRDPGAWESGMSGNGRGVAGSGPLGSCFGAGRNTSALSCLMY